MDTKALRQKILDLAIHGKLVPQDPNDEPASVLLERIRAEKERLIKEGKIKKGKKSAKTSDKPHYPFELPKGWVWTTLGEILELISGQDFPPEKYNNEGNGIPYIIGASNIENERLFINRWTKTPSVLSFENDLLVVCKGAGVGKMAFNNVGTVHIARQIQAIRNFSQNIVTPFIKIIVLSSIGNIVSKANGLIPGLKRELLLSMFFPFPPYNEQQRIVDEIQHWFSLIDIIENDKVNLQNTIKQAKAKVLDLASHGKLVPQDPNDEPASELLKRINPKAEITCDNPQYGKLPKGWCSCTLRNVCSFTNGFAFSSDAYKNNGIPLVRISNITNEGKIDLNSCVYIQDEIDEQYIIEKGDFLVAMSGATTGKMGVYTYGEISYLNQRVGKIKASKALYTPYMHYLMYSQVDNILKMAYGGAQPNISAKAILAIRILLPPLAEQQRIVAKIEDLFTQLDKIEASL